MKDFSIVGIYSAIHFIVDMACAFLIIGMIVPTISSGTQIMIALVVYNMFAFAFQLPFGIMADFLSKNALVSSTGCLFLIAAYGIHLTCHNSFGPIICIVVCLIAGIGNALFHVGGGIDVLNISNRKASLPGIYVSTGAMGLFLGSKSDWLGITQYYPVVIVILAISALALYWLYKQVSFKYKIKNETPVFEEIPQKDNIIMWCILLTIGIRGYLGLIMNFEWKSNFTISLIVVGAVVGGKILGGIVGDIIGWKVTSTASLVISAFLFIFAFDNPICGVLAILLFNMTMPITLTALSNVFFHNKGMAFGMTTLALFIGAIPVLSGNKGFLFNEISFFIITLISAVALFYGLCCYEKRSS